MADSKTTVTVLGVTTNGLGNDLTGQGTKAEVSTTTALVPLPKISLAVPEGGQRIYDVVPADVKAAAEAMAKAIDLTNPTAILNIGGKAEKDLADFTNEILQKSTVGLGEDPLGEALRDFQGSVAGLDVSKLQKGESWFAKTLARNKLKWVAKKVSRIGRFERRFAPLSARITDIQGQFVTLGQTQQETVRQMEIFYQRNTQYFRALEVAAAAGEVKLAELAEHYESEKRRVTDGGVQDLVQLQEVKNLGDKIRKLEVRVQNLRKARMAALITGPAIQIARDNADRLAAIANDLAGLAVSQWRTNVTLKVQAFNTQLGTANAAVAHNITNNMIADNLAMLGQTQRAIADQERDGVVSVDALVNATNAILAIMSEGLELDARNKEWRKVEFSKMQEAERRLTAGMQQLEKTKAITA